MNNGNSLLMVKVKVAQSCPTLCNPMHELYSLWNSLGQNTGVHSRSLLQGIYPTPTMHPSLFPLQLFTFFLAALGLHCCMQAFSSCGAQTSHCGGVSRCGARALQHAALSSFSTQAQ